MMLISMKDVQVLIEFFKSHVVNIRKGAKVLLERIEDFSELAMGGGVADFSGIQTSTNASTKLDDEMFAGSGVDAMMSGDIDMASRSSSTMNNSALVQDHFSMKQVNSSDSNQALPLTSNF